MGSGQPGVIFSGTHSVQSPSEGSGRLRCLRRPPYRSPPRQTAGIKATCCLAKWFAGTSRVSDAVFAAIRSVIRHFPADTASADVRRFSGLLLSACCQCRMMNEFITKLN
ncbi:hypothetical protein SKAU_G00258250 [Synaphobranchus kaupii]|uniref:Uncharacterized protein n=1 Tax=Synaphobranchus kaupii TaxID=118154 RepID=A0A9Q1F4J9_SYNKA|nr:hypothetical protein SKAU_G00258250 [Synaphobranchus kaupii]